MCSNICFIYRQATTVHPSVFYLQPVDSLRSFRRYYNNSPIAASPLLFSCSTENCDMNCFIERKSSSRKSPEMGKLSKINSVVKAIKESYGNSHIHNKNTTEEERFKNLLKAKEKVIKIHFFVQDALGGSNPTVWEVARSPQTSSSPTTFGQVRVVDDLITADSDRNSEKLGRAQGIISFSDLNEPALTMNLNFYFMGGEYKGSSLCIVGRNPISHKDRELPIVGGTGIFRMARGYTISNTYSFDSVTNYGVLEYTLYVAYVDQEEVELPKESTGK